MSSRICLLLILFLFVTSLQSQPPETERPADSEQNSYSLRDLLHSKNNDIASNTDNIVDIEQDHMSNTEDNNAPDTDDNNEAPSDDLLNDKANEYNPNNPEPTNDEQSIDELIETVDNIYDVEQTHNDIANEEEQTQPIPDINNELQPPPHYEYNDHDQNNQESIDDPEPMQNVHESDDETPTQTQSIPDVDDIVDLEVIEADNTETEQLKTPQTDTYENNNDIDDGNDDMYNDELLPPPDHASNANINEEHQYQTNPNENSGTADNYYNEQEIHDHDHDDDDGHFHYPEGEYIDEYGDYDPDDDDEFDDEYPEEYYHDPVQVQADEPIDGGMDKKLNEDIFEENDAAEQKTSFFDNIMNTIPQILSNMNDIRGIGGNSKDNNYMQLYEQCNAKLNILEKRLSASSIVELNINNRIGVTFLFVLMDIIICIICYPRKSVLGTFVWMLFWSLLSFMSYTSNRNSPLFIVLAVNAVFPLLTKTSN